MIHAPLHGSRDVGPLLEPGQVRLPVRDGDVAEGPRAVLPDRLPAALGLRAFARVAQELRGGGGRRARRRGPHGDAHDAAPRGRQGRPRVVPRVPRQPGRADGQRRDARAPPRERRDGARARRREARRFREDPRRALARAVRRAPDVPVARPDRGRHAPAGPQPRRPLPREPAAGPRQGVEAVARPGAREPARPVAPGGARGALRRALQGAALRGPGADRRRVARHAHARAPRLQPPQGRERIHRLVHLEAPRAALPGGVAPGRRAASAS